MQSLDQPLDAIIQSKRKQRQPRRQRGSKPQTSKQSAGVQQPQVAPQVTTAQAVASQAHVGDKIIVSNLPDDVNEQQIKVSLSLYSSSTDVFRFSTYSYEHRSCSTLLSGLYAVSTCLTTLKANRKESLLFNSTKPNLPPPLINNTTNV